MRYGSLCSGIEAATQAWHPLGWSPEFFSEIDKFPSAVLAHHYGSNMPDEPATGNGVPNYGDMTTFEDWPDHAIDILVGGTPCQTFSVAGLRAGLADPRGNLMLTFGAVAKRYRPKWIVWENVPGVLSSNGGRDFGTFLRLLGECGYGFAYRVLDAQHCRVDGIGRAVPQRRRRVFVVGCLGDWRSAAAVLFEPESLRWDTKPRRQTKEGLAAGALRSTDGGSHWDGSGVHPSLNQSSNIGGIGSSNQEVFSQRGAALVPVAADALTAGMHKSASRMPQEQGALIPDIAARMSAFGEYVDDGTASTVKSRDYKDATDLIAFNSREDPEVTGDRSGPLGAGSPQAQAVAFAQNQRGEVRTSDVIPSLGAGGGKPGEGYPAVLASWAVRRLTPIECERLQGFPDGFTQIPWRGKAIEDCPDGPRYKALGNSMAVNAMRWIGTRIQMIEELS